MRGAPRATALIREIADLRGFDLTVSHARYKLEVPGSPLMPLVIEKLGKSLIFVCSIGTMWGETVFDPGMMFVMSATDGHGWAPIILDQAGVGPRTFAQIIDRDGREVVVTNPDGQLQAAFFADQWAINARFSLECYLPLGSCPSAAYLAPEILMNLNPGRKSEVARLAGVSEDEVVRVSMSDVRNTLGNKITPEVYELTETETGTLWRAGDKWFFDDPYYDDVVEFSRLYVDKTLGLCHE